MSAEHVLQIDQYASQPVALGGQIGQSPAPARSAEARHLDKTVGKYFLLRFGILSAVLYSFGFFNFFAPDFTTAAYFGLAICTVTSFISFFITEWAFDQPKGVFMTVAMGSMIVRMFNLLIAFAIGMFFLHFHQTGLVSGMFAGYFSYLVVEIAYIHTKGLLRGH